MLNQYKIINRLIIFNLVLFLPVKLVGQTEDLILDDSYNKLAWTDFVVKVEKKHNVQFYFDSDSLPNFEVSVPKEELLFLNKLNKILKPYNHNAAMDNVGNIFVTKNIKIHTTLTGNFFKSQNPNEYFDYTEENNAEYQDQYLKTNNAYISKHIIIGKKTNDNRTTATISGYVKNMVDNLPIVGGTLQIQETGSVVVTNGLGFYTLHLRKGNYTLIIRSVESKEEKFKLKVLSDGKLDITLKPNLIALDEVIVSAEREHLVRSTQMGYQKLETKELKEIPLVLGERDVVKVSLLLPGVQSVGEGSSGFNVRGSPTDQNLFIINNVPIYNSSHLFGFFSAFNSDAIEHFSLYKSNIPANYGGRLSSIFDIKTKQGNKNNFKASGGISPVTARLLVEGPIKKKSSSYMVGFRSTYSDWLLKQVNNPDINKSKAQFADIVTNFSFDLNENNQINLFSYHSYDRINLIDQNKYNYTNNGASLAWNHLLKQKHKLQISLIYSQYNFTEENSVIEISSYKDNFELKHSEAKASLTLNPISKHTITAGVNSSLYLIDNGNFLPLNSESLIDPINLGQEKALEMGIFLSDEWVLSPKLSIIGGVRYNNYLYLGPQNVKTYSENEPKSIESIIDTVSYSDNQIVESYNAPDIRFAARYLINDNISIKLSFNQLKQYLFMLTNTIAISPTDKWKLSDNNIKPMSGSQYSLGVYNSFVHGQYNISLETYYKNVNNLVEYKDGANLVVNETPEIDILQGNLDSYGVEFMLKKSCGRFNGWLNYTYSRALVTVNSEKTGENINYGESYHSNYDKPHAINIVANYKFLRRFSLSSNMVYSTGRPITYPVGIYYQNNMELPLYSKRNEYRVPDYFRIDFSLKLEGSLASKKFAHSTWIFSVYNLTGRKNAYSVYFNSGDDGVIKGYKLSIFGAPIVSLTYNFKLGNYAN
ncbi:MAG: TonB-dependent receptor [Bacteroidetes bacterium]|nr:MAG: TonB-dependent receptor [Bacteroidota bacterium]